jgi:acyl-[acyl carrier protein]--UDP-N-acetylglucosamine O-acyltransferase
VLEAKEEMVAGVGIEPTTRGFSKSHRQLIRKYFKDLYRRNRGATQARQAKSFNYDKTF